MYTLGAAEDRHAFLCLKQCLSRFNLPPLAPEQTKTLKPVQASGQTPPAASASRNASFHHLSSRNASLHRLSTRSTS